ncbi:MAG: PIN domain-containing protein [Ginsengibacter sp.]
MINILIDTNCWVDLLKEEKDDNLSTIDYWVENGAAKLLIPAQLHKEWQKQKDVQRIFVKKKEAPKSGPFRNVVKLEQNILEEKIARIENLFNSGQKIKPTKSVQAEVTRRYDEGKAPFHRDNNNSNADALLFLTAARFIQRSGESGFVFVTRDADDYGDEVNPQQLHRDYHIDGIDIEYFTNIGAAVSTLKKQLGEAPKLSYSQRGEFVPIFYLLKNYHRLSLTDQLFDSLTKYKDQLEFIPTNILIRIFPFKIENQEYDYTYHSPFQINTNNKKVIELFRASDYSRYGLPAGSQDQFGLRKKAVKDTMREINQILNNNLIFKINSVNNQLQAEIMGNDSEKCDCVLCSYNRLDFVTAYKRLAQSPLKDVKETMKHAYIHFQFGNFLKAFELFYHSYQVSDKERKSIQAFICLYNLKRLSIYIRGYFSKIDETTRQLMAGIEKVTLEEYKLTVSNDLFAKENIEWIQNNEFYNTAFQKIEIVLKKIRDHYYTQLAGGWSTNSNYHILLSELAEIETFLDANSIIYNNYSEFTELINSFMEGMFTVYSLDERQSQKLFKLDNPLIVLIAKFSDRETIIKYFKHLHLKGLKYTRESKGTLIETAILQLLHDVEKLNEIYSSENGLTNQFFWDKYRRIFGNLILFVTISAPDSFDYNRIFEKLVAILPAEKFLRKFDSAIISDFVKEKGKYFTTSILKKFLLVCIDNDKFHDEKIFHAISLQISRHHPGARISDNKTFETIVTYFLQNCPKCKNLHSPELLLYAHNILSATLQKKMQHLLVSRLNADFNQETFYLLAILDIIDYKPFFSRYLSGVTPVKKSSKPLGLFNNTVANYLPLSQLLNLCFKNNIDLNAQEFQKFKGISDYYDWLLDMEHFNYDRFNPHWILAYRTVHYLKKIFTNEKTSTFMGEYLKQNKHPVLAELYIEWS